MKRKWPQKVYPTTRKDWHVSVTSQMAVELFPDKPTLRATLMLLQIGYTVRGREFTIPSNSRSCWEVEKVHIGRAKKKLKALGLIDELDESNNGRKRRYKLTEKAIAFHGPVEELSLS